MTLIKTIKFFNQIWITFKKEDIQWSLQSLDSAHVLSYTNPFQTRDMKRFLFRRFKLHDFRISRHSTSIKFTTIF